MRKNDLKKNSSIECLRAIAIILVVLQHYRNRLPTPQFYYQMFDYIQPWTGVDLFLSISGYLVCKTLLEHLDREPANVAIINFWKRRAARLLPALAVWAAISILVAMLVSNDLTQALLDAGKGAMVGLLGIANIYWTLCAQRHFTCVAFDYNSHFWSLALEWQLYAFLAASVVLLGRRKAIIAFGLVALFASLFPAPSFSWAWSFRPQAFFLGTLAYVVLQDRQHSTPARNYYGDIAARRIALALGVCVVTVAPVVLEQPLIIPAVSMGAVIALLSTLGAAPLFNGPPATVLEWIGARSYSIYLCHLSIIYALRKVFLVTLHFTNPASAPLFLTSGIALIVLTCIMADLSYRFVERPAIRWLSPPSLPLAPR